MFRIGEISCEQQNLIMGHHNSETCQQSYLSTNITADVQATYRGLPGQGTIMRSATSLKRTMDPRRPTELSESQKSEVEAHVDVKAAFRAWQVAKNLASRKRQSSPKHEECRQAAVKAKQTYLNLRQRHFRAKKIQVRKHFDLEQPILDLQRQVQGLPVELPAPATSSTGGTLRQRKAAIDALFTDSYDARDRDPRTKPRHHCCRCDKHSPRSMDSRSPCKARAALHCKGRPLKRLRRRLRRLRYTSRSVRANAVHILSR